ncbi:MAG: hypothetical protein ACOC5C_06520 [Halobacteriota archaeon]
MRDHVKSSGRDLVVLVVYAGEPAAREGEPLVDVYLITFLIE